MWTQIIYQPKEKEETSQVLEGRKNFVTGKQIYGFYLQCKILFKKFLFQFSNVFLCVLCE